MCLSNSVNSESHLAKLSKEEMENPELVFSSFFESFDLKDTKRYLMEAEEILTEKKFCFRQYSIEEDNLRFFFDKVEKLLEAAWVMKS